MGDIQRIQKMLPESSRIKVKKKYGFMSIMLHFAGYSDHVTPGRSGFY